MNESLESEKEKQTARRYTFFFEVSPWIINNVVIVASLSNVIERAKSKDPDRISIREKPLSRSSSNFFRKEYNVLAHYYGTATLRKLDYKLTGESASIAFLLDELSRVVKRLVSLVGRREPRKEVAIIDFFFHNSRILVIVEKMKTNTRLEYGGKFSRAYVAVQRVDKGLEKKGSV